MLKTQWLNFFVYHGDLDKVSDYIKLHLIEALQDNFPYRLEIRFSFLFGSNLIISIQVNQINAMKFRKDIYKFLQYAISLFERKSSIPINNNGFRFYSNNSIRITHSSLPPINGLLIYCFNHEDKTINRLDTSYPFYKFSNHLVIQMAESESDSFTASLKSSICFIYNLHRSNFNVKDILEISYDNWIRNNKEYTYNFVNKTFNEIIEEKSKLFDSAFNENKESILSLSNFMWHALNEELEFEDEWINYYNREMKMLLNSFQDELMSKKDNFNSLFASWISFNISRLNICDDQEGMMCFILLKMCEDLQIYA